MSILSEFLLTVQKNKAEFLQHIQNLDEKLDEEEGRLLKREGQENKNKKSGK